MPTAAAWVALVARVGPELAAFEQSAREAGQNGFDYWREWISRASCLRRVFHTPDGGFDFAGHGVAVQHLAGVFDHARRA